MVQGACLCGDLPNIRTQTRVVVVSHVFELARTTNTAHFARLMLPELELVARGGRSPVVWPSTAPQRAMLLYPDPAAQTLEPYWAHIEGPLTLVVPDGSWPQARRAARRDPLLRDLPRLQLPPGPPTRFLLRDQTRSPQHLCTLEAIARALGIIEGDHVERALIAGLDLFVTRILASRGRLKGPQRIRGSGPLSRSWSE